MTYILCDILSKEDLNALWDRIQGIRRTIAAIKGLKRDEKTGLYYYTGTEADDTLRQLKQLKALRKKYNGDEEKNRLEDHTAFYSEFVKNYWIEDMYDERKKALKKK